MTVHLIGLSKTIPSSIVSGVYLNSLIIGIYGSLNIFELQVFMSQESIGCQKLLINLSASGEILSRFDMLSNKRVIVPKNALSLRQVFVYLIASECQSSQLIFPILHIENVREYIKTLKSIGILKLYVLKQLN